MPCQNMGMFLSVLETESEHTSSSANYHYIDKSVYTHRQMN